MRIALHENRLQIAFIASRIPRYVHVQPGRLLLGADVMVSRWKGKSEMK